MAVLSATPQLVIPHGSPLRPTMVIVGVHGHAGHLERCRRCGREFWTAFGRARRHYATSLCQDWPQRSAA